MGRARGHYGEFVVRHGRRRSHIRSGVRTVRRQFALRRRRVRNQCAKTCDASARDRAGRRRNRARQIIHCLRVCRLTFGCKRSVGRFGSGSPDRRRADREFDHAADESDHGRPPLRTGGGSEQDSRPRSDSRVTRDRGCQSGARRNVRGETPRFVWRRIDIQLLPREEPRRLRRRRSGVHFARGRSGTSARLLRDLGQRAKHVHEVIGENSRLDTMQAAILRVKLRHLDGWNALRREAAARYDARLHDLGFVAPRSRDGHVFQYYVVSVLERQRVIADLAALGVQTGVHHPTPIHLQPAYAHLGASEGSFPIPNVHQGRCYLCRCFPRSRRIKKSIGLQTRW